ncbi:alpha-isopropylmalate synthase regulatory domain-containing protein [Rhabdochromatium marinum]|uniref:alpha-isopropylmalate synthase regulatory domain-containing protein n=1 Tax=Rhabdochromatium marinum TaxID=48729 RepID=UPI0030844418
MNLYSQGVDPGLDLSDPDAIIAVVEDCTEIGTHPRHPWFGELVYMAFSGSHQDAIGKCLKRQQPDVPWQVAYLPIDPRDLGRDYQAVIQANSQSGKGGMAFLLEREFGLHLPAWLRRELAPLVQRASEDAGEQRATGTGAGVIEAFSQAWASAFGGRFAMVDYQKHAISAGTEAEAAAYVLIEQDGTRHAGAAINRDSLSAAIRALLSALNRATLTRETPVSKTALETAEQSLSLGRKHAGTGLGSGLDGYSISG